jgi:hypothetical protein
MKLGGEGEPRPTEDEHTVAGIDSGSVVRDGLGFPVGSVLLELPGARIEDQVALLADFLGGNLIPLSNPGSALGVRLVPVDGH